MNDQTTSAQIRESYRPQIEALEESIRRRPEPEDWEALEELENLVENEILAAVGH